MHLPQGQSSIRTQNSLAATNHARTSDDGVDRIGRSRIGSAHTYMMQGTYHVSSSSSGIGESIVARSSVQINSISWSVSGLDLSYKLPDQILLRGLAAEQLDQRRPWRVNKPWLQSSSIRDGYGAPISW